MQERKTATPATCPRWCDGVHDVLYDCAGEPSDRDHFAEIGRLVGERDGDAQIVVGIADGTDGPAVLLLLLDWTGAPPELLAGEVLLTLADVVALGRLLGRAAAVLAAARSRS